MPRLYTVQTNFSSGELDPLAHFRVDIGAYKNGARQLRNSLLFATGGEARRPGTYTGSTLPAHCRLIPFEFSNDEKYVIAFSAGRIDVYDLTATLVVTVATGGNWTTDTLWEFSYAQAADTLIVCHPTWAPQVVLRTSATTFEINPFEFTQSVTSEKTFQPYFKFVDDDVTLACSATTGAGVTLTASGNVFSADMVGEHFRWQDTEILITGYTNVTTMTGTIYGTLQGNYDNNPFETIEGGGTVEVTHVLHGFATGATVTISGAGNVGGITAAELNGAKVVTVIDDNTYSIATGGTATESTVGGGPTAKFSGANLATRTWYEPTFNVRNGFPGAVTFHEGRLWFGGSTGIPDGLWSSKIFQYYNFDVGDGIASDSIQITVGSDEVSNILHLISNGDLQIFTASNEFVAKAPRDQSLAPSNTTVSRQSPYGSSYVRPVPFDGATLYLQRSKTALREFIYSDSTQRYNSTNLNILSGHLISAPYSLAVLYAGINRSEQYAFLVNSDGTLAVFHSARSEQLAGWVSWDLAGVGSPAFKDVCTVGDEVFFSIQRHGNYYIERYSQDRNIPIDGATLYTGAATTSWVVDAVYFGKTVAVVSGNYYLGEYPVDGSGNIELEASVTSILVGYTYVHSIKTLPINLDMQTGNTLGRPKRIVRAFVGLDTTLSLSISGNRLILRQVLDDFSIEPVAVTGTYEFRMLGYQKDAFIEVTQVEPLPCAVLGMSLEVSI